MPIRVLLVEDSPVATLVLKRALNAEPGIEVVGTARTGKEGLVLIPKLQPQVICTDLHMPEMDGLEFTEEVMIRFPRPILVVSSSVQPEDTYNVFRVLQAGAVDVFPKPDTGFDADTIGRELVQKIKILAGVTVFTRRRKAAIATPAATPPSPKPPPTPPKKFTTIPKITPKMVAIGASTGGPQALYSILSSLPADFPVPVVCVQHISEGFLQGLVDWLGTGCRIRVKVALFGEMPQPGTVYFPPEKGHLLLDRQGRFLYSVAPPVGGHRPAIDLTFESVAKYHGAQCVGILLTGMGADGAKGLKAIAQVGGTTIAQNEASCVVFGMPKVAIALQAAQHILSIDDIAPWLLKHISR